MADDFCGSLGDAIQKGSCMSGEHITETQAWTLIAEVLGADWLGQRSQVFSQAECSIEITASGEWFSRAVMSEDARRLLDVFLPLVAAARPLVIAQLGQSLDGRIATESGASHYINGEPARRHLHRLRAVVDAVVVGVGTLNADDPQLTVRHASGANPARVVLDPRNRADPACRVFADALTPVWHVVAKGQPLDAAGRLASHVSRIELDTANDGGFEPAAVLAALAARGMRRVLIEGGGVTVSRFVVARALDRLHVIVAPMLIGSGRPGLVLAPIATLDEALRPRCRVFACGADSIFDLELERQA